MKRHVFRVAALALAALLAACAPKDSVRPGGAAQEPSGGDAARESGAPRIEVSEAILLIAEQMLEVRYAIYGVTRINPEPSNTYVIDEATGEKFGIAWLRRIGRMASTKANPAGANQYMLFRNRDGILKPGRKITVVVGESRQEHVVIKTGDAQ